MNFSLEAVLAIEIGIFIVIFVPTMIAFFSGAPWVPTPAARAKKMVELAKIRAGERVYDLGCGDGRVVQCAADTAGADAVGIELSPLIYFMARVRNFILGSRARIVMRDFRRVNLRDAKVIFFYLLPNALKNIREKLERELQPGTRIVSYAFEIEGWTPSYIEPKDPAKNLSRILVYKITRSHTAARRAHAQATGQD